MEDKTLIDAMAAMQELVEEFVAKATDFIAKAKEQEHDEEHHAD